MLYRISLEEEVADYLKTRQDKIRYEKLSIKYVVTRIASYKPDFILDNGIIIEVKGWFRAADRKKHLLVKEQYPKLDIRFIFGNENNRLYKGSKTTYAYYCDKHGILWAEKEIPKSWLNEKKSK